MNSLYTYTRKRTRAFCIYKFNKVCLERLSYLKSVSHIINILRLFSLYGEIIVPQDLGNKDRAASSHTVIRSIIVTLFNTYGKSTLLLQMNIPFTFWIIPLNSRVREYLRNSYF